jgi:hypothetical protein
MKCRLGSKGKEGQTESGSTGTTVEVAGESKQHERLAWSTVLLYYKAKQPKKESDEPAEGASDMGVFTSGDSNPDGRRRDDKRRGRRKGRRKR